MSSCIRVKAVHTLSMSLLFDMFVKLFLNRCHEVQQSCMSIHGKQKYFIVNRRKLSCKRGNVLRKQEKEISCVLYINNYYTK